MVNIKLDYYIGKHCQIISKLTEKKSDFEEVYYDFGIIKSFKIMRSIKIKCSR